MQQDLVSTHRTLRAQDPLLPVCLRVFLWHSLPFLVNQYQLSAYLLKSLVLLHLRLLRGLELPPTLLPRVPQGHLPCSSSLLLGQVSQRFSQRSVLQLPTQSLLHRCSTTTLTKARPYQTTPRSSRDKNVFIVTKS